jgi:hypothetical protein
VRNRRHAVNFDVGPFICTVGFNPETGAPCELFLVSRGKSGTDLDDWLYELGVKASKIMQDREHEE